MISEQPYLIQEIENRASHPSSSTPSTICGILWSVDVGYVPMLQPGLTALQRPDIEGFHRPRLQAASGRKSMNRNPVLSCLVVTNGCFPQLFLLVVSCCCYLLFLFLLSLLVFAALIDARTLGLCTDEAVLCQLVAQSIRRAAASVGARPA